MLFRNVELYIKKNTASIFHCITFQNILSNWRNSFMKETLCWKTVYVQTYKRRDGASRNSSRPHIGRKVLAAEYVEPGQILVKQRLVFAFNPNVIRNRHFKIYPGENVTVSKTTSLYSTVYGRVKFTRDVLRNVTIINVLPEIREELLRSDLWRYRFERVQSVEENRNLCWLRTKAGTIFPKLLINPPKKPLPQSKFKLKPDMWENPNLEDSKLYDMGYPIKS